MKYKNSMKVFENIYNKKINSEFESIDYKKEFHFTSKKEKLELTKDIVSMANTNGGMLIYGVTDRTFEWIGLDENSDTINDIQIREFIMNYINSEISFQVGNYKLHGEDYYLITIDKCQGELIAFLKDGEYERTRKNGSTEKKKVFSKNDEYGRIGSSSKAVNHNKTFKKKRNSNDCIISNLINYSKPYTTYIDRPKEFDLLIESLNNKNIRNVQINGLGGIGKTSFIRNFCDVLTQNKNLLDEKIDFLIWITGKLNKFNLSGDIEVLRDTELTYAEMLDIICDVLDVDKYDKNDEEISKEILSLFSNYNVMLIFDNMETIHDINILRFIKAIPLNCRILFTTRTSLTTVYERIDLDGFDYRQFIDYVKTQLFQFDKQKRIDFDSINCYMMDLHELVHGSPIITNMIVFKLCSGFPLSSLINELRRMKKNNTYYDQVMDFCFEDVLNDLSVLEKTILFIMSMSTEDEMFQVSDFTYILDYDFMDVSKAISKLFNVSFCYRENENYGCTSLVKAFTNRKLEKDSTIDTVKVSGGYYNWVLKKKEMNRLENDFFLRTRAFSFQRKEIALQIKQLTSFDISNSYDYTMKKFDELIEKEPNFSYTHYKKGIYERYTNKDKKLIVDEMKIAIDNDPYYDYYYAELAFYYSDIRDNKNAINYFDKALKLNDANPSTNHGIAIAYTKNFKNKTEYFSFQDEILLHFSKGYFDDNSRYSNSHNARNAHAHATYLMNISRLEEALEVCRKGFTYSKNNVPLKTLFGNISTKINPNYVSQTRVNDYKQGIFSGMDDESIREIINIVKKKSR